MKASLPLVVALAISSFSVAFSQNNESGLIADSTATPAAPEKKTLTFTGYADSYYANDNDANASNNRAALNSLNTAKHKFALNLIQLTANIDADNYRGKLTLQYGDLPQAAWISSGADVLTFNSAIQEGFAGMKLSDGLWLDAGYFLTHIGGESITPKDNWFSTLSLATQFEPFFQAGLKLTYDVSSTVSTQLHLLNGYNRFTDNNEQKSVGYYVSYKPDSQLSMSLSGIVGNEQPDGTASALRVFNNAVITYAPTESFQMKVQGDVANQQMDSEHAIAYGGFVATRYSVSGNVFVSARGEYYHDNMGMLTGSYHLEAMGGTFGLEVKPNENAYIRLEGRAIHQDRTSNQFFGNGVSSATDRIEEVFSVGVMF